MKKRIMWLCFAITALALIVFSVISTDVYYGNSIEHTQNYLRAYMGIFDETRTLDTAYAEELSEALDGARVTFLTTDGAFIADSEDEDDASRALRPEVREAMESGEGFDARSSATMGENFAYYCKKFESCLVRIAVRTDSVWGIYLDALPAVICFLVADALLCLLLTYLMTGFMLRPMEDLVRGAAKGERVTPTCTELEPVAALINRIGFEAAQEYGVPYLPTDFKKRGGYLQSVQLSKEYGLYRQNYCGCVYSRREREQQK